MKLKNKKEELTFKSIVTSAIEKGLNLNAGVLKDFESKDIVERADILHPKAARLRNIIWYLDEYEILKFVEYGKLCELLNKENNNFIDVPGRSREEIEKIRFEEVEKYRKEYRECLLESEEVASFIFALLNSLPNKELSATSQSKSKLSELVDAFKGLLKKDKNKANIQESNEELEEEIEPEEVVKFKQLFNYKLLETNLDEMSGKDKDIIADLVELVRKGVLKNFEIRSYLTSGIIAHEEGKMEQAETEYKNLQDFNFGLLDKFWFWDPESQMTMGKTPEEIKKNELVLRNIKATVLNDIQAIMSNDLAPAAEKMRKTREEVSTNLARLYELQTANVSFVDSCVEPTILARYSELVARNEYVFPEKDQMDATNSVGI